MTVRELIRRLKAFENGDYTVVIEERSLVIMQTITVEEIKIDA
jgi:hypothetical protein